MKSPHHIAVAAALGMALGVIPDLGAAPDGPAAGAASTANGISAEDSSVMSGEIVRLDQMLWKLRSRATSGDPSASDLLADVDVFRAGAEWAFRYELSYSASDLTLVRKSISRGIERADAALAGRKPWIAKKGKVLRGFISAIDGSTQPYGVIVPAGYDGTKPMRLDVVLHGSSKPAGMSELRFGARFDEGDTAGAPPPDADFIELHPLGRVENCYRWAGETDVFEAIEAACRNYRIDRNRIVLRGMSMGASGTWHLGLQHPDFFAAIGPYCGYVDTHHFSMTPDKGFVPVGALPAYQEKMLHMLDAMDYAANASVVPAVGAIGSADGFFGAHVLMNEAMAKEGVQMINLISPGTKHVIDPVTHAEQMKLIGLFAEKGLDHAPSKLRFVTWTLKYNRCHWLEVLALKQHYERAEFAAKASPDGLIEIDEPKNITEFAIHRPMTRVRIAGKEVALRSRKPDASDSRVFALCEGEWICLGAREDVTVTGKRPGLQGPIDDAFASPFLCVRPSGEAWSQRIATWADANLRRFTGEWQTYMRGVLPVKNDTDVTEEDVRTKNLILFGDPGSNLWIRKALPGLPITWTKHELKIGAETVSAEDHAPVLICASPLQGAGDHYLVINSGHTFHNKEFSTFNYLLFPRLGDWAVMKVAAGAEAWHPGLPFPEEVERSGFFDEQWKAPFTVAP
jgi:pimeloyl-ACP methyl ester carboxylesterase